jgi:alkylation response protein AidB-like acyl-CoA dehydrogenase
MITGWTEEHEELRSVVRRFLTHRSTSEAVRAAAEAGAAGDPDVWRQMADQLGLQSLAVPEEHGGAGMGPIEIGVVLEEMGRVLYVGPYLSSIGFAAQALTASGDHEAQSRWLPALGTGELTAALALSESNVVASPAGSLSGVARFVVDGATAGLVLLFAGDDLYALDTTDGDPTGLSRRPQQTLDPTRAMADLRLDEVPAVLVSGPDDLRSQVHDLAAAALAAEQVGGAARALDMAVGYAKERVQFGRPIGSFQAIKHACADLLIQVESARSAAFFAAALLAEGDPEGPVAASVAQAWCSTTFTAAAKQNIQVHGGLGYTWEHDAHLYLRRAKVSELLLGSPVEHRARVADLVGI